MIRPRDAILLAHTKLRTHKVRTGITVGVAGMLFGLIFGGTFIAQGIFESVDRFSQEGLADRSIVTVSKYNSNLFDAYTSSEDKGFVSEVKQAHEKRVQLKTATAKKYSITYDAKTEDPSPIEIDPSSGVERVSEVGLGSIVVQEIVNRRSAALYEPLDITKTLEPFHSAKVLKGSKRIQPSDGSFLPIENGKEKTFDNERDRSSYLFGSPDTPVVQVLNETITKPFIVDNSHVQAGELPGVVSYAYAEKLLGLEPLARDSTSEQKLERLQEVRGRIGEITASLCYRNESSQLLLNKAKTQQQEIERNKSNKDYVMPAVQYNLPAEGSCGPVTITKDTRTQADKRLDANFEAYKKEIGESSGEPLQHKVVLRAIGLSGDATGSVPSSGIGDMVAGLLSSWLFYGPTWSIPADLLASAPAELRPEVLFAADTSGNIGVSNEYSRNDEYIVEFTDKDEARALLQQSDMSMNGTMIVPYGSGVLVIDQMKRWFFTALLYALAIVGGVALVILASLIGRMVSDGRKESAVFRAIGAKRIDIGSIYGMYALLLSLRAALFSLVLGLVIALGVEFWYSEDATLSARFAYAAADTDKSFHFIGVGSWYIPAMIGAIVLTGLLASIIPIFLGARRNPINDMRDDR